MATVAVAFAMPEDMASRYDRLAEFEIISVLTDVYHLLWQAILACSA